MYVDHILNKSIAEQFATFYEGFHSVCNSAALKVTLEYHINTTLNTTLISHNNTTHAIPH